MIITRIKKEDVDLIVYDFDGVMTDNRAFVFQDGTEAVMVSRADGLGVNRIRSAEIPQLILSTETNPVVRARAAKLRLEVISSCKNKRETLIEYCRENCYSLERTVFIGNDLNDLPVMGAVGYPISPADGHPDVLAIAKAVTSVKGGDGVIKEFSEKIMIY